MIETNQLTPDQISEIWQNIKVGFETGLPPVLKGGEARMLRILTNAMDNKVQVWQITSAGEPQVYLLTYINVDFITGVRNLLIYSMFSMGGTPNLVWDEGFFVISKFAKANGCLSIMAFTENEEVIRIVKQLKGNTDQRLVYMEV